MPDERRVSMNQSGTLDSEDVSDVCKCSRCSSEIQLPDWSEHVHPDVTTRGPVTDDIDDMYTQIRQSQTDIETSVEAVTRIGTAILEKHDANPLIEQFARCLRQIMMQTDHSADASFPKPMSIMDEEAPFTGETDGFLLREPHNPNDISTYVPFETRLMKGRFWFVRDGHLFITNRSNTELITPQMREPDYCDVGREIDLSYGLVPRNHSKDIPTTWQK